MFGYTVEEMLGQPVSRIIPIECSEEKVQILARVRRGERVEHYETVRRHKDGRLVNVFLTISPIRDGGGHIIGASKIARDITEQKKLRRRVVRLTSAYRNRPRCLSWRRCWFATWIAALSSGPRGPNGSTAF